MKSLEDIRSKLREIQPDLKSRYGVSGLWIYGSRIKGNHRPDSDVDVLVAFHSRGISLFEFAALSLDIEAALGLPVDLVEKDAIRPELRNEVLPEAVAI